MSKPTTAVKAKYNAKAYAVISFRVPKVMASAFRTQCEAQGVPQAQIFKRAIQDFMSEKERSAK